MMRSTGRGGPTAEELRKYEAEQEAKKNRGIYTAEMGEPPQDIDMKSATPPAPAASKSAPKPVKKAKGGSIDGCAQRGKTKGRFV